MRFYKEKNSITIKSEVHKIVIQANWTVNMNKCHLDQQQQKSSGNIKLILKRRLEDRDNVADVNIFGDFDGSFNQTDMVFTKEEHDIVKKAQKGDFLVVQGDKSYIWSFKLEIFPAGFEHKPLFHYRCPIDNEHTLEVFHAHKEEQTNERWMELTTQQTKHGCGHQRKLFEDNIKLTQYFCHTCQQSFCSDCAFKHKIAYK